MTNLSAFSLSGRRALVTGGGRGLGAAMANGLVAAGARVALVARNRDDLRATAERIGDGAVIHPADVVDLARSPELLDGVEEALGGPVDIVVHAAGVQHRQPAESFDPDAWDHVLQVNLTAPFQLSREIGARQLAAGRSGSHIFVGSLASRIALPDVVAYAASKSGVIGVVRALSHEWSGRGIRVNGIGPGYIRTRLTEEVFRDETRSSQMLARIPMQRFGEADELAGAAVFLASDASSYITGQLLMVDGGWTAS